MHLFYVSHDYMGTWTLTLPSTKTGSMMQEDVLWDTQGALSSKGELKPNKARGSFFIEYTYQTDIWMWTPFSCVFLHDPGYSWALWLYWASMGLTHHLVVFGHAFSWAPKVGAKNKSIGLCIHNVATNSEGLSVQLELWFQTQTEVNSALRPCLVLLNCISHHWIITVLCELPLLHIPRSASLSHS